MFETQHRTRQLWESEERWGLIARHDTLSECVEGIHRVCFSWEAHRANPDDYRIVKRNRRGRIVEIFDAQGELIDGFVKTRPNPVLIAA